MTWEEYRDKIARYNLAALVAADWEGDTGERSRAYEDAIEARREK